MTAATDIQIARNDNDLVEITLAAGEIELFWWKGQANSDDETDGSEYEVVIFIDRETGKVEGAFADDYPIEICADVRAAAAAVEAA